MAWDGDTARTYRTVMRSRSLRRVLIAFLFFNAEEYGIWIAITVFAYDIGGATTAGLVAIAQLVPAAILAPFAAVLGDRMRRDRALALGYGVQAAAALICGLAIQFGPPMAVYMTAILTTCAITLTRPVHNALLPDLSRTTGELTAANSVSGTVEGLGTMLGPLLTAALVASSGLSTVLFVFAVLMLVAAVLTYRLDLRAMPVAGGDGMRVLRSVLEGAHVLRDDHAAAVVALLGGAQFFILGVRDILYAVLAIDVLDAGAQGAGLLASAVGVGGLIGALATFVLVGRVRLATPVEVAVGAAGGATASLALVGAMGPAILVLVVAGASRAFFDVASRTLLQRSVRHDVLSRVFGLQEALLLVGLAVGSGTAPILVAVFGDRGAFVAAGALLAVCGVAAWPALRQLDRRAVLPDPERYILFREIDIFRPVAQPALERLVADAQPLRVEAGTILIREGDVGDRFYVVTEGRLRVERDGKVIATLGPAGYVGEIALLRDVPRTADVVADIDTELLAVEREVFLDAVTGSRRGSRALDTEVERRLAELDATDSDRPREQQDRG